MTILRNIAIAVLAISLLTFVALFGRLPALRRTPIGWLQRVLCLYIPNSLRRLDNNVTNGQMIQISQSWVHYLFYQRNPIVLVGEAQSTYIELCAKVRPDHISLSSHWKFVSFPVERLTFIADETHPADSSCSTFAVHIHLPFSGE